MQFNIFLFLKIFRHRQQRSGADLEYDSFLKLEMSSVLYVHTQRFVAEILAFYEHFSQLQSVVNSIHSAAAGIVVCWQYEVQGLYKILFYNFYILWQLLFDGNVQFLRTRNTETSTLDVRKEVDVNTEKMVCVVSFGWYATDCIVERFEKMNIMMYRTLDSFELQAIFSCGNPCNTYKLLKNDCVPKSSV
jgi:hypothetical protein